LPSELELEKAVGPGTKVIVALEQRRKPGGNTFGGYLALHIRKGRVVI